MDTQLKAPKSLSLTRIPGEVFTSDWTKLAPRSALRCMPAIAGLIFLGLALGKNREGVIAASGAFSVGFGSFQQLRRSRVAPMFAAALGICVASWIGTFAGFSVTGSILAIAFAGATYAVVSLRSSGASWVAQQCVVWLVISTAYPIGGLRGLERGVLLLAGGLLQMIFIVAVWYVERRRTPAFGRGSGAPPEQPLHVRNVFAFETAITLAIAAAIYRFLPLANAYWIPMTAVILLKPDRRQTFQRGWQRMFGTTIGAAMASAIILVLPPMPRFLGAAVILFSYAAYNFLFVNYAAFAICLTAYVVFMLALAGLPERSVIVHRVVSTLIGGGLVLLIYWFGAMVERHRTKSSARLR